MDRIAVVNPHLGDEHAEQCLTLSRGCLVEGIPDRGLDLSHFDLGWPLISLVGDGIFEFVVAAAQLTKSPLEGLNTISETVAGERSVLEGTEVALQRLLGLGDLVLHGTPLVLQPGLGGVGTAARLLDRLLGPESVRVRGQHRLQDGLFERVGGQPLSRAAVVAVPLAREADVVAVARMPPMAHA